MASDTPAKIIIGIGLLFFIIAVAMGRYFPANHPDLALVIKSCSIGVTVVGFINLWQIRHAAKKDTSKR